MNRLFLSKGITILNQLKQIYFTVTNDLSFDQRMQRICTSLSASGFTIILVGRELKSSMPLQQKVFSQKRLRCFFNRGFMFYAEYNIRLFFYLLSKKMDGICAIDLDTILPCLFLSKIKRIPRIYDAHEYFTELKEVRSRPFVKKIWLFVEQLSVPQFKYGYTVSKGLANEFKLRYGKRYEVIRNFPVLKELDPVDKAELFLLYQGAVNEGRGFEYLIPAMKLIPYKLVICGDGNFMDQLKRLIWQFDVQDKIDLKGMVLPEQLLPIAQKATIGIGLAEKEGINQYLALPNKFLDYIHAGLPQITMAFPEYELINSEYKVALLLDKLSVEIIAESIDKLMKNEQVLAEMQINCLRARKVLCWQNEEKILVSYYKQVFNLG